MPKYLVVIASLFSIVIISSCSDKKPAEGYQISWNLSETNFDTAYLYRLGPDKWEAIDSNVSENQNFKFIGSFKSAEYLSVSNKSRSVFVNFISENETVTISSNVNNPGADTIVGSTLNEQLVLINDTLAWYDEQLKQIVSEFRALPEPKDSVIENQLITTYDSIDISKVDWIKNWVYIHPSNAISELLIVKELIYLLDVNELDSLTQNFTVEIQHNGLFEMISEKKTILHNSAIGKMAPEITMVDTLGNMQNLSNYFGNYLLIDFWASWCGPCRAESENMVRIYNRFHPKGYDIVGVSLDNKESNWKRAIVDDKLAWNHISDLKGWDSQGAKDYGVSSIPQLVLLDPQGVIIARGFNTEELEAQLEELFSEEK